MSESLIDIKVQETVDTGEQTFIPSGTKDKKLLTIVYVCYGFALMIGFTALVGVIIAHEKKKECKDPLYISHYRYQIRTFFFSVLWFAIGAVTMWFGIGTLVLIAGGAWWVYRVVKGGIYLNDKKSMY